VSSYYEAIHRISPDPTEEEAPPGRHSGDSPAERRDETRPAVRIRPANAIVSLPVAGAVPVTIARAEALQRLAERLAPLAMVERSMRLFLSGCRPADGASTIASAFALDMSQRLSVRTLLIDAHLRHPSLHRIFAAPDVKQPELVLDGALQIRASGWPRLEVASCAMDGADEERQALMPRVEAVLCHYGAVIVDLGVIRLDPRMLALARPTDPILLVARYGHTRRQELATTAAALRAANRAVAGVVFNAAATPFSNLLRKLSRR
jgi:Mrp family chromosome partitioning ATPase